MNKILYALTILLFAACGSSPNTENQTTTPKPINGSKLYTLNCQACHGAKGNLKLNGAKDFTESNLTLEERIDVITNGRKTMLPYKDILSKAKIEAVAKYTMELSR